jgi:hypothetical protein
VIVAKPGYATFRTVNEMSIANDRALSDPLVATCSSPLPGLPGLTRPAQVASRVQGRQHVNHSSPVRVSPPNSGNLACTKVIAGQARSYDR